MTNDDPTQPTIDDVGRPEPPLGSDEVGTLRGFLDFQRATLAWKAGGVDADGMRTRVADSSITLGGLLKHMALVEEHWFSRWLHDRPYGEPWVSAEWDADGDWDWNSAADDSPDALFDLWTAAVERSRAAVDEALDRGDLGQLTPRAWPDGRSPSLRWILCHMIEEYARHNGHADLIRESIDGLVGE